MRFADIWFSALLVLLIPTRSSVALATAKSSGLFGIPAGGSTKLSHTQVQAASIDISADAPATDDNKRPLHVLFLSADTGGGHRASAEAILPSSF